MISFDYSFMLQNVGLWRHNGHCWESGSNFFSFFFFFLFFKVCQCLSVFTLAPAVSVQKHQRRQSEGGRREKTPRQNKYCPPCLREAGTEVGRIQ